LTIPRLPACLAAREVFNRAGDKWSIYIVGYLRDGLLRFNELRRSIEGISERMLTLTLRGLERDGLAGLGPLTSPALAGAWGYRSSLTLATARRSTEIGPNERTVLFCSLRPSRTWGSGRSPKRAARPTLRDGIISIKRAVHDGGPDFQHQMS
jgi:hypothetical protein